MHIRESKHTFQNIALSFKTIVCTIKDTEIRNALQKNQLHNQA